MAPALASMALGAGLAAGFAGALPPLAGADPRRVASASKSWLRFFSKLMTLLSEAAPRESTVTRKMSPF